MRVVWLILTDQSMADNSIKIKKLIVWEKICRFIALIQ